MMLKLYTFILLSADCRDGEGMGSVRLGEGSTI